MRSFTELVLRHVARRNKTVTFHTTNAMFAELCKRAGKLGLRNGDLVSGLVEEGLKVLEEEDRNPPAADAARDGAG